MERSSESLQASCGQAFTDTHEANNMTATLNESSPKWRNMPSTVVRKYAALLLKPASDIRPSFLYTIPSCPSVVVYAGRNGLRRGQCGREASTNLESMSAIPGSIVKRCARQSPLYSNPYWDPKSPTRNPVEAWSTGCSAAWRRAQTLSRRGEGMQALSKC